MPRRNQQTIAIENFDGIHSLPRIHNGDGDVDGVGPGGLEECYDRMITAHGHLVPRPGIIGQSANLAPTGAHFGVKRRHGTGIVGVDMIINFNGEVFDTGVVGNILVAAAGSDLVIKVMGSNRIFLSVTPASGTAGVFVWDRSIMSVARKAAGAKPTGTFTVAVSGTAGNMEPGQHIYAVCWETNTGFITKPALYVSLTSPAARKKVDLNPIPTGPAGTVARHILMSRVLRNWDGNLEHPELFFALRIADNVTTNLSGANGLSKFDSELLTTADYLKDVMEELPTVNNINQYRGRLVLAGGPNDSDPVRVSQPGDYETFLATEGYLKALPADGGVPECTAELNGVLYVFKDARVFGTEDTGESPNRWPVIGIDSARGCGKFGIAQTPGTGINVEGMLAVLTREGLLPFNGNFSNLALTHKIGGLFTDLVVALGDRFTVLSAGVFKNWNCVVDTSRKLIYIFVGIVDGSGSAEPNNYTTIQVLVGDYTKGLSWETIRWFAWRHYNWFTCMSINHGGGYVPLVSFGQGRNLTGTVGGSLIVNAPESAEVDRSGAPFRDRSVDAVDRDTPWRVLTGPVGLSVDGGRTELEAISVRAAPLSSPAPAPITVRVYNADNDTFISLPDIKLDPRTDVFRINAQTYKSPGNLIAERMKVELSGSSSAATPDKGHRITDINVHASPYDEEQPA